MGKLLQYADRRFAGWSRNRTNASFSSESGAASQVAGLFVVHRGQISEPCARSGISYPSGQLANIVLARDRSRQSLQESEKGLGSWPTRCRSWFGPMIPKVAAITAINRLCEIRSASRVCGIGRRLCIQTMPSSARIAFAKPYRLARRMSLNIGCWCKLRRLIAGSWPEPFRRAMPMAKINIWYGAATDIDDLMHMKRLAAERRLALLSAWLPHVPVCCLLTCS